ncbi:acyloxyacyl hydrolase [Shewanella surugensis]|uniref:Lipid A deacylase n=1 Tax=Shewanella surugensis TaxID=212020 RepID=A0ABT0LD69_9GAMM|nr:acyloxyacyl hydrolase [Shewanella surugensis]MCL1125647.1 acyloxyacyl hydrolase [Shewanella surugensis]
MLYHTALQAKEVPWIDHIALGVGHANGGADTYRLGIQHAFASLLWQGNTMHLSGYYELSVGYWNNHDQNITNFAFSPVFQFLFFGHNPLFKPYAEFGIGIAYLSKEYIYDDTIKQRNLSSEWQFEDRASLGVKLGKYDINLRYLHYSNAGFKSPNDGMDIIQLTFTYQINI